MFISVLFLAVSLLGCGAVLAQEKTVLKETEANALWEKACKGDAKALAELRARAEKGDAAAQASFGAMYEHNRGGVTENHAEAARWYRKAAVQGFAMAQHNLGTMCLDGRGVRKDVVEAAKWFRKAADQGFDWSQYVLGQMYEDGVTVPKDVVEAYKWFLLAGKGGNDTPKEDIALLEKRLTAAQRAEGQKRARAFTEQLKKRAPR